MSSGKHHKYMKQYGERNYAPKIRKLEKNDIKKHSNRSESRETSKTSCCDSLLKGRKEPEKVIESEDVSNKSLDIKKSFVEKIFKSSKKKAK